MAYGLPVVALASGAVREIVEAERTGILVDRAEPVPWVEALRPLLHDSHRRRQLGSQAREHVRVHFSADGMIDKTLQVYEKALGSARVGGKKVS
jgi:glycosyltransferase involved in cell wall biosynthesis